jgi:hypothetical protein
VLLLPPAPFPLFLFLSSDKHSFGKPLFVQESGNLIYGFLPNNNTIPNLYYCHRFYTRPSDTRQRRSFSFLPGAVPRRNVRGTLWRGSGASPPLAGLFYDKKIKI